MTIASAKAQLDTFFQNLDSSGTSGEPGYFIEVITPLTASSVQDLQTARNTDDINAGFIKNTATDRSDRYIALANLVGNGSSAMDIAESDYSGILDSIGQAIVVKAGTFTLERAPTSQEEVAINILHADGTVTSIAQSNYSVNGLIVTINNVDTILSFKSDDQISIFYQPSTVF